MTHRVLGPAAVAALAACSGRPESPAPAHAGRGRVAIALPAAGEISTNHMSARPSGSMASGAELMNSLTAEQLSVRSLDPVAGGGWQALTRIHYEDTYVVLRPVGAQWWRCVSGPFERTPTIGRDECVGLRAAGDDIVVPFSVPDDPSIGEEVEAPPYMSDHLLIRRAGDLPDDPAEIGRRTVIQYDGVFDRHDVPGGFAAVYRVNLPTRPYAVLVRRAVGDLDLTCGGEARDLAEAHVQIARCMTLRIP